MLIHWWVILLCIPSVGRAAVEGRSCSPEPTDMIIKYGNLVNCKVDFVGDSDILRFAGAKGETINARTSYLSGRVLPLTRYLHRAAHVFFAMRLAIVH